MRYHLDKFEDRWFLSCETEVFTLRLEFYIDSIISLDDIQKATPILIYKNNVYLLMPEKILRENPKIGLNWLTVDAGSALIGEDLATLIFQMEQRFEDIRNDYDLSFCVEDIRYS